MPLYMMGSIRPCCRFAERNPSIVLVRSEVDYEDNCGCTLSGVAFTGLLRGCTVFSCGHGRQIVRTYLASNVFDTLGLGVKSSWWWVLAREKEGRGAD